MDREQIKELLREVLGPNTLLVDHENWVGLPCPLARWKHSSGHDRFPSAGVSVKDDDVSIFHCYACHSKGPLQFLLKELEKYTGDNYAKLIRSITDEEFIGGNVPEWGSTVAKEKVLKVLDYGLYRDIYEPAEGHTYLRTRGISDATARKLELLVDPGDSTGDERILFPVFGFNKDLYGFTGRAVMRNAELKVRDYHGLPKAYCLLGSHLLSAEDEYVVVVEGLFDYARLAQWNIPVVAVMHSGITKHQLPLLLEWGKPVILFFDEDEAGIDATGAAAKLLRGKLPVSIAKYKSRLTPRKGKGIPRDPGVLSESEVIWGIANAKLA